MSLNAHFDLILNLLSSGKSYSDVSFVLKTQGVSRGSSEANIRKFCTDNSINPRSAHLPDDQLDSSVSSSIQQGLRLANPIPYHASYYGHKLHMDQNEKLGMFGATHCIAVDGYSSRIVRYNTMPYKNNLSIYEEVFRPAVLEEGMWDTVRVDGGREFYVTTFMQTLNRDKRYDTSKSPALETQSKHNLRVERVWVDVNCRVNYPIKTALVQLQEQDLLNLSDPIHRFCCSNLTMQISSLSLQRFVEHWNHHPISGRGVPNSSLPFKKNTAVTELDFPPAYEAADIYTQQRPGSSLTYPSTFSPSPFRDAQKISECDAAFLQQYPDLYILLDAANNANYMPLQNALLTLIQLTTFHSS